MYTFSPFFLKNPIKMHYIVQWRFDSLWNAWMGTWSDTLVYHILATSQLSIMDMMSNLLMLGYLLMMYHRLHRLYIMWMTLSACK